MRSLVILLCIGIAGCASRLQEKPAPIDPATGKPKWTKVYDPTGQMMSAGPPTSKPNIAGNMRRAWRLITGGIYNIFHPTARGNKGDTSHPASDAGNAATHAKTLRGFFPKGVDWNNATPEQIHKAIYAAVKSDPENAADIALAACDEIEKTGRFPAQGKVGGLIAKAGKRARPL